MTNFMIRFKKSLLLFCIIFSGKISYGQEISLAECRNMALENNKKIAIARNYKTISDLQKSATFTHFLPKFSASGLAYYTSAENNLTLSMGNIQLFDPSTLVGVIPEPLYSLFKNFSSVDIPDMNFKLKLNNTYTAGVHLEQPIYMGGKIRAGYKMSKIGTEIADFNIKLTEAEVILETDKAYWMYVQALQLQKSAQSYKEVVEDFYRIVHNAVEAGMKSKNDLMKVQVQLNQANLQVQRAKNGILLAKMNLCQILGKPLTTDIIPSQSFEDTPLDISSEIDISARPEYTMLNKQIELKEQEKRITRSDFLPAIGVRGSYNYTYGVKLNEEHLFNDGGFSAMLSLSVPLFHWTEGAKKVKMADAETSIMRLQREELNEKMTLELQQAINIYQEMILEVTLTQIALEQAKENLQMSRNHYEAGMENISDYLEAQAIWQNAESEYIVAKAKLEIGKTEYLKASGRL